MNKLKKIIEYVVFKNHIKPEKTYIIEKFFANKLMTLF